MNSSAKGHKSDNGSENSETVSEAAPVPETSQRCPACFRKVPADVERCPHCGYPVAPPTKSSGVSTQRLTRIPTTTIAVVPGTDHFPVTASVILQLLPSGTCLTLALKQPIILGRGIGLEIDRVLDLTEYNAVRHGVSRQHCKLERVDDKLYVTDLGSCNGTHLNHEPLLPHRAHAVKHGDQLVLGTLHVFVAFSTAEAH